MFDLKQEEKQLNVDLNNVDNQIKDVDSHINSLYEKRNNLENARHEILGAMAFVQKLLKQSKNGE